MPVDMPPISVFSLHEELLLPAGKEQLVLQLGGAVSFSGEDTELIWQQRGLLPRHGLVLLPQRELLLSVVHALWPPKELLQPVGEQLFSLQGRELPPKEPK